MRNIPVSVVVQGRFHAFALAKALIELEVPLEVVTNYPVFIAEKFGLPRSAIKSFPIHGVFHRYAYRWNLVEKFPGLERLLHTAFSKSVARHLAAKEPSVVHVFSGVALDIFSRLEQIKKPVIKMLARGSCHIRDQYLELCKEGKRAGVPIDKPSPWMMRRELNEYKRADKIVTLSSFAQQTFIRRGYTDEKIQLLPLGANTQMFRPAREVIDARLARLRSGTPLRVLSTGTVCLRKGILDFIEIAKALEGVMKLVWVGNVAPDAAQLVEANRSLIEFIPRMPEHELPRVYNDADCYLFPTIEDGYAVVLAQAKAGCLPILASVNCAGPDLIQDGVTGWSLPIREPNAYIQKLLLFDHDREATASVVESLWARNDTRGWREVGVDFISLAKSAVQNNPAFH